MNLLTKDIPAPVTSATTSDTPVNNAYIENATKPETFEGSVVSYVVGGCVLALVLVIFAKAMKG